jgi:DNA-binding CsgD family transcriptional regulator
VNPQTWTEEFTDLSAARRDGGLNAEGCERLALAAYMVGNDDACEAAWITAHEMWLAQGETARAAGCAFQHALGLFFRGDLAPAMGWVARGGRLVEQSDGEPPERAWLMMLTDLPHLFTGNAKEGLSFVEAGALAERCGDVDAVVFARLLSGYALISEGRIDDGMRLLDEVMVAVTANELNPMLAGIAYCQVITLCHGVFDLRRAREWTDALTRWCDAQPGIVPFRGNCLVHRCEIFQLQGAWADAQESARRACEWLAGPPVWDALGSAYYQLAEIQRLRGELADSEASYRQASAAGRDPEPGMSLLRLVQGRVDLAVRAIRRALDERQDPPERSRLLPAAVEVRLAGNDLEGARLAAEELAGIAEELGGAYLHALSAHATGAVLVADGEPGTALATLRTAQRAWRDLGAPHEAARVRVLLGAACAALGDAATAESEFDAARVAFDELGAVPDLKALARASGAPRWESLSPRECEVLILVAAGKTNRAIAQELFISEKTVARHLANIFIKLRLNSRAQATAYAYRHGLVQ